VVAWETRPQGIFIKLDFFGGGSTKDHPAQAAITQRQGFVPSDSRVLIPEHKRVGRVILMGLAGCVILNLI
jgi:hypothetical protein